MSAGAPGAHDRRVATLGATLIVVVLVGFRGIPEWRAWRAESRADAAEQVTAVARDAALLAAFPIALDSLEARSARLLSIGSTLLTGETLDAAAANLAALMAQIARSSLVRLEAVQVRYDSSRASALPRVSVAIQGATDITGLALLLQKVEKGPIALTIRRLRVRPQNIASPSAQVESLSVRLTVEALVLIPQRER